jgi:hypothetical protein
LSRKYGILDISQPYGPPLPVTGIDLLFLEGVESDEYSKKKSPCGPEATP